MSLRRDQLKAQHNEAAITSTVLTVRQFNNEAAEQDYRNITDLKKQGKVEVNLGNSENPIAALAKLGYTAGSLVGLITVLVSMADVLKDMELNKQFLVSGTDDVDMFKLEKVFNCLDGSEGKVGYERIFNKKQMRRLVDKLGRNQTLVFALKSNIADFVDQLSRMSSLKQEELVLIGQDLEIIGRVMQELEIDSAKKPQVKDGMLAITDFMSVNATKQAGRDIGYTHNFDLVVKKHRGMLTEEAAAKVKFEMKLNEHEVTMFNFDETLKVALDKFYSNNDLNTMTDAEIAKSIRLIKEDVLQDAVVIDPAGELASTMADMASSIIEHYVGLYEGSNNDIFKGFAIPEARDEEANMYKNESLVQSINTVQKIAITVYEMIIKTFAYNKYTSLRKVEELAELGRRAIYTAGVRRGFTAEETFDMAINAGWLSVRNNNGEEVLTMGQFPRFKFKAVEAIFSTELKHRFNAEVMANELELEFPEFPEGEGVDIEDGYIEFVDGQCEIVIDNEEYYITCLNDADFTGLALIDIDEEENVSFFEYVDIYKFEELDFLLFNELSDTSLSTNAFMKDDIEAMTIAATPLKAINTVNMNEGQKDCAMKTHGKVVETALNNWSCFSTLPIERKSAGFSYKQNNGYVYVSNQEGRSRMLGKLLTSCSANKISEVSKAYAVATVNAGFLILN